MAKRKKSVRKKSAKPKSRKKKTTKQTKMTREKTARTKSAPVSSQRKKAAERDLERGLEESFPGSDPVAATEPAPK
jgi:hypothetical protein